VKIPFISYAHEDAVTAKRLYTDLASAGANPWLDSEKLLGGQDWEGAIRKAIREATHFIALISKNSVNKRGFVQKELRHALEVLAEFPPNQIFLIPVRLDSSNPQDEQLRRLHRIDLFPDYSQGLRRICDSLGISPAIATPISLPVAWPKPPIPSPFDPGKLGIADDVIEAIRARAAEQFPDDFSTRKYVIEEQTESWQKLQRFSDPEVPSDVVSSIFQYSAEQHPDDFSTQFYLIESEIAAWHQLQVLNARGMPEETLRTIIDKAERNFPNDFSTRLYVIQNEISAWRDLYEKSAI
jgi:hypothetical protein